MADRSIHLFTQFRNPAARRFRARWLGQQPVRRRVASVQSEAHRQRRRIALVTEADGNGENLTSNGNDFPKHGDTIRAQVETLIEQLIATLDELDGDCDLEPELAGFDLHLSFDEDREGDDERESDPAEDGIADYGGLAEQVPSYDSNPNLAFFAV